MSFEYISTEKAPKAVGPYSQAIRAGDFLFISGNIGIEPSSGKLKSSFEAQAEQVLNNIVEILKSAGLDKNKIVKTTVFLTEIENFQKFNEIYAQYFGETKPARSTVEVSKLPLGALVEIEAIAFTG